MEDEYMKMLEHLNTGEPTLALSEQNKLFHYRMWKVESSDIKFLFLKHDFASKNLKKKNPLDFRFFLQAKYRKYHRTQQRLHIFSPLCSLDNFTEHSMLGTINSFF